MVDDEIKRTSRGHLVLKNEKTILIDSTLHTVNTEYIICLYGIKLQFCSV